MIFCSFEEAVVPVRRSARTRSVPMYNFDEIEDGEQDADGGVNGPGKDIYESVFLPGHDEEEEEVKFVLLEVKLPFEPSYKVEFTALIIHRLAKYLFFVLLLCPNTLQKGNILILF